MRLRLVGNLGANPDVAHMPNGRPVANIRLATSEAWKDRQTGETQQRTEWHSVVLFDKLADVANEYLRKGAQVYIEGKLRTRRWQDRNGNDRYTTEVIAYRMQLLSARPQTGERAATAASYRSTATQSTYGRQTASATTVREGPDPMDNQGFEDDIPF